MVFESTSALVAAVESLVTDPDVEVVRIKNRLDPAHRRASTAGFRYAHCFKYFLHASVANMPLNSRSLKLLRLSSICCSNVVVNLCLRTADASRLGIGGHVCELQFVLRTFADALVSALSPPSQQLHRLSVNCMRKHPHTKLFF